ncbi:uncharacterized protein LOC131535808 [Onychostoma macrolepis]|uniref:uncharacterized protein LOC131535808 n=1 Tax=Onychostoma macrolepis TaxID=369639 RepID=UPI0027295716|nr:uncharacterized protein LOC131535808 [Onychostoma macrolepis]
MSLPVMTCRTCLASWTPEVGDLLCSGYWRGTVEFQTIYQLDIFTSFEDLKITAPGLSRQAFVKMLQQRSQQFGRHSLNGHTVVMKEKNSAALTTSLAQLAHQIQLLCLQMETENSIDSAKQRGQRNNHFFDGVFLANDKDVATFVDCVHEKTKPVHGKGICGTSTWAAARETSKKTNIKCDEEGLEVAVQWGGKNQIGAGTTIGEEVEQVNSFLSRVALTTKYMSKAARVDMITLHARGWNERKKRKKPAQVLVYTVLESPDDLRTDDPVALQHLIEGLFLGIQQKKRDLYRVTDHNKQRHKIRRRIREDKKKLFNAISQYNDLSTTTESVAVFEISGFPHLLR